MRVVFCQLLIKQCLGQQCLNRICTGQLLRPSQPVPGTLGASVAGVYSSLCKLQVQGGTERVAGQRKDSCRSVSKMVGYTSPSPSAELESSHNHLHAPVELASSRFSSRGIKAKALRDLHLASARPECQHAPSCFGSQHVANLNCMHAQLKLRGMLMHDSSQRAQTSLMPVHLHGFTELLEIRHTST